MKAEEKENKEIEEKEDELNEIAYQSALSTNWIEGLMQRIQQSLISNTPLIMCEKDLEALDFLLLTSGCADSKTVLATINKMNEEVKEEGKDSEIESEKEDIKREIKGT